MAFVNNEQNLDVLEEDNRDLLFANKCLEVVIEFKSYIDSIFDKIKHNLDENDFSKYKLLSDRANEIFEEERFNRENDVLLNTNKSINAKHEKIRKSPKKKKSDKESEKNLILVKKELADDEHLEELEESMDQTIAEVSHKSTNDKKKAFECTLCGRSYASETWLNNHINAKHNGKKVKKFYDNNYKRERKTCEMENCSRTFNSTLFYKLHLKFHVGDGPIKCPIEDCDRNFEDEDEMVRHIKAHRYRKSALQFTKKYECDWPGCDYSDVAEHSLRRHKLLVHTPEEISRTHECKYPGCGKKFKLKTSLDCHHKTHMTNQQVVCDICGRTFKHQETLRKHKSNQHAAEKNFVCDHPGCDFRAAYKSLLNIHQKSHSTSRPFVCSVDGCGKRFGYAGVLKSHMESHTTERNYNCEFEGCSQTFRTKNNLKRHIVTTHSSNEFRCDWPGCEYVANHVSKVKNHSIVHKTERDVGCDWPQCGKRFKSKTRLDVHMKIHTNDKRYVCQWPGCQYKTANSGNFVKHRRRVHLKNCPY